MQQGHQCKYNWWPHMTTHMPLVCQPQQEMICGQWGRWWMRRKSNSAEGVLVVNTNEPFWGTTVGRYWLEHDLAMSLWVYSGFCQPESWQRSKQTWIFVLDLDETCPVPTHLIPDRAQDFALVSQFTCCNLHGIAIQLTFPISNQVQESVESLTKYRMLPTATDSKQI